MTTINQFDDTGRFRCHRKVITETPTIETPEFAGGTWDMRMSELIGLHFSDCPAMRQYGLSLTKRMTSSFGRVGYGRKWIRLRDTGDLAQMDNTLKHELVHAYLFERFGRTGHTKEFWLMLSRIGEIRSNNIKMYAKAKRISEAIACERSGELTTRE